MVKMELGARAHPPSFVCFLSSLLSRILGPSTLKVSSCFYSKLGSCPGFPSKQIIASASGPMVIVGREWWSPHSVWLVGLESPLLGPREALLLSRWKNCKKYVKLHVHLIYLIFGFFHLLYFFLFVSDLYRWNLNSINNLQKKMGIVLVWNICSV